MTTQKKAFSYDKPPIIEAVVQFRFFEPISKGNQTKLLKRFKRQYVNEVAVQAIGANLNFAKQEAQFVAEPQFRLSSYDEADVLMVHPSSLTWSRLAPYEGWGSLLARVSRDFQTFNEVAGPRKVAQLGVRYINRIDVPLKEELARYEDYLTINLSLPEEWENINGYAWRFEKSHAELGLLSIIQSAVVMPEIPDHGAFLLDIDIVNKEKIPAKTSEMFVALEGMRKLKNEIFELSISDQARASFE